MKRILSLVILFITSYFLACDFPSIFSGNNQLSGHENLTQDLLSVEITGGIAGVNQRLVVDESGVAYFVDSFYPGAKWVVRLSPDELNGLISLFVSNNFFQLNTEYISGRVADAFFYIISFNLGNVTKTVTTDYFGAPENLKRIVDGLLQLKTRITNNGLDLKLELSQHEIVVGDKVDLKLLVTNSTDRPLTLHFSSGQIFDFYALIDVYYPNPIDNDSLVWNWAHDKVFAAVLQDVMLEAGETRSYQVAWDGRDNSGNLVQGDFNIAAELVSIPGGRPVNQKLTIVKEAKSR